MVDWEKERDYLYKYIFEDKLSYKAIGEMMGVSCQAVRKAAKKLGLVLPKRRKINENETFNRGRKRIIRYCLNCGKELTGKYTNKYCSNKCQRELMLKEKYEYYINNQKDFVGREIRYEWLKKVLLKEQECTCQICGMTNLWNGKELHFVLDHIDGDATNNKRDNLRLVCPNCDSQLSTYKSRNIGKSTRKYKPYRLKK